RSCHAVRAPGVGLPAEGDFFVVFSQKRPGEGTGMLEVEQVGFVPEAGGVEVLREGWGVDERPPAAEEPLVGPFEEREWVHWPTPCPPPYREGERISELLPRLTSPESLQEPP